MNVGSTSGDFEDEFPGTGRNRYVYKIRSVDAAGNRGDFSSAFVVHLHDVMPPSVPKFTKVMGQENQITVQWTANADKGLTGYAVYRTDDASLADDPRNMQLVKNGDTAILEYVDTDVTARVPYYYGLVAVRQNSEGVELRSAMSRVATGQAYNLNPPEAPEWESLERSVDGTSITVKWRASQSLECLLKRRSADSPAYMTVAEWVDISSYDATRATWIYEWTDTADVDANTEYVYIIKVRDEASNMNTSEESSSV